MVYTLVWIIISKNIQRILTSMESLLAGYSTALLIFLTFLVLEFDILCWRTGHILVKSFKCFNYFHSSSFTFFPFWDIISISRKIIFVARVCFGFTGSSYVLSPSPPDRLPKTSAAPGGSWSLPRRRSA